MDHGRSLKSSGAWVHALPMLSWGHRMDDSVVHVATGLSLGVTLCRPNLCQHCGVAVDHLGTHGLGVTLCRPHLCQQCGIAVDHLGTHGLSCRKSQGHFSRHTAVNDTVNRSLAVTKIPSHHEPSELNPFDG